MTTAVNSGVEELLAQLDPARDYGDRTYDEVVAAIQRGEVLIEPGSRLPVLRDARMRRAIKGSGQPPQTGVSLQQQMLHRFRERAADDFEEAYDLLFASMRSQDPRSLKIWFEIAGGKVGENRGGEAMATAFKALIDAMQKPDQRWVEASVG